MRIYKTVLGIDPGLATTGFAVIKKDGNCIQPINYGIISTKAGEDFASRLEKIYKELNKIIKKYKPEAAACEELFFCKNVKTALAVGQARGVILLAIKHHKLPLLEFTPLQVKQSLTGYGQADKKQIQYMVSLLLNMKKPVKQDDTADALAIALSCLQNINSPLYAK
ncbi:MAG: crossover junction endodeoxyribonuclease RuvC [Patescibacteria group bacterium]|jgi:crossover junction endodeoxyribonuclease RuvC